MSFFVPAFTLSVHFSVMFLPGLLNFLTETTWLLFGGGLLLFLSELKREKWLIFKPYVNWGYLLFAAGLAGLAVSLRGQQLSWIDNFTHWATAVKAMLSSGGFPTFAQPAVTFSSYPLGSAALISYFSYFVGEGEDIWMLAQGFMLLCLLLPMFAYQESGSFAGAVFAGTAAVFLLKYNIPVTELLVDTLLPLAGVFVLLLICRECLRKEEALSPCFAIPALFWLMNVKNAGVLFTAAWLLLLFWQLKKSGRDWKPAAAAAVVLVAAGFLWSRHCDYVFYQDDFARHEISMEYFRAHLGDKTLADAWKIACLVVKEMVLRREMGMLAAFLAALWAATALFVPENKQKLWKLTTLLGGMFVVYAISLIGMYVFSMELYLSLQLISADRYIRIWEIAAYYLQVVYALSLLDRLPGRRLAGLAAAVGAVWVSGAYYDSMPILEEDLSYRKYVETPIAEYGVAPGYSYLLCTEEEPSMYAKYLWMYHLNSGDVQQIHVTQPEQMKVEKYYDYVILLERDNPILQKWAEETYPDQAERSVIQKIR